MARAPTDIQSFAGATITSIKGTKRDPERRMIRAGSAVVATLPRAEIDRLGVREGQSLSTELIASIEAARARDGLKRYAMRALSQRAMSEGELRDRLAQRGADEGTSDAILARLRELGLIDDEAYARSIAQSVVAARPAGARLIESKLRQRRLPPEAARAAAQEALASRDPVEDACQLARRKARSMPPSLAMEARRRRVYSLLARRGFDPETCAEATRRVLKGPADEDETI